MKLLLTQHTIIEVAKPTKIALMYVKVLPLTNMWYISGWVVNVYRLLMVRDINYSAGKFSRGFNSPLTKAEIRHTIIVKVEILSPNTLHNVRQRNIVNARTLRGVRH